MRRFGNPTAPIWLSRRARGPAPLVVVSLAVVIAVPVLYGAVRHWIELGDLVSAGAVLVLTATMAVTGIVLLFRYRAKWVPVTALARKLRVQSPSVTIIARIPEGDSSEPTVDGQDRRTRLAVGDRVVAQFDNEGLTLWAPGDPPTSVLELAWRDVSSVIAAEYVEGGTAFEGLAIVAPSDAEAIVLQVVRPKGPLVLFTVGAKLDELAKQINALRLHAG